MKTEIIEYVKDIFSPRIKKYKKWRRILYGLTSKIMPTIPMSVMQEAAGDLGLLAKDGSFIVDSESDMSYVSDRAFYDIRKNGKNSVDTFFDTHAHTLSADETKLVYAMQAAYYSLFEVERIHYGYGVYLKDVFSEKNCFLWILI